MGVLEVWGVGDDAEAIYRALLRNPGHDLARLAAHLERDEETVRAGFAALQRVGLARCEDDDSCTASPPAATLGTLLRGELTDLEGRRAQLDGVRASLASFAADHMVGQTRGWAKAPFELLSDEESFVAAEDLQRTTTGEVISCHPVENFDVDSSEYIELIRRQLAEGRPMRGLYPASVVDDPDKLAYVRFWAAAGEEVRLMPSAPPQLAVFGNQVALVSSRWEGVEGSKLLVHAPALVALVRELFEQYWARGLPLRRLPDGNPDAEHRQILELLMLGAKDETIGRQLGISLRTVRRRVADLMADLGATTRFQAGMEAVRRGLL